MKPFVDVTGEVFDVPAATLGCVLFGEDQVYLHTNSQRDRVVADALNPLLAGRSGTRMARHAVNEQRTLSVVQPPHDEGPGNRGPQRGAGDENRTRTVSLGS